MDIFDCDEAARQRQVGVRHLGDESQRVGRCRHTSVRRIDVDLFLRDTQLDVVHIARAARGDDTVCLLERYGLRTIPQGVLENVTPNHCHRTDSQRTLSRLFAFWQIPLSPTGVAASRSTPKPLFGSASHESKWI